MTMLQGIDISSWQEGIDIDKALDSVDFCIVKATGGTQYVNPFCDQWVQRCIDKSKLWGFYHFANDINYNSPTEEADYFYQNCKNYFGHGIPVLDWEVDVGVGWVNMFVRRIHELTGIWCWVYGNPWRFSQGNVEQNCGRWIASYPGWIFHPTPGFDPGEPPDCDGLVAAWQYASDGEVPGFSGNIDMNVYYGDASSWIAYATATPVDEVEPEPSGDGEPEPIDPTEPDVEILENEHYRIIIERKMV